MEIARKAAMKSQ